MHLKKSTILFPFLITIAVLFAGIACTNSQENDMELKEGHQAEEEGLPLIYHMSFISRYSMKLYFAGEAENWELADIYSHEIEEITKGIVDREEEHDGINIGELMGTLLLPQIEELELAIDSGDREMFLDRYNVMIQTCNQCHVASDYGAVKVTVPELNPFNQDFNANK
jgi:hypothetical protein